MTVERFKDTASTSLKELLLETDEGASTAPPTDVLGVRFRRPGLFIAAVVLNAALAASGPEGALYVEALSRRRQSEATAETSTAPVEVDPVILKAVRELFEEGASEFFQDGVISSFSRTLLRMLKQHGQAAFRAIAEYVFSGNAKPDVVSEALRWLADFNDPLTLFQRWAILQRTLNDPSPRVRDGAILGFGALDDPRARQLLVEAHSREKIGELRALIDQVLAQLQRAR